MKCPVCFKEKKKSSVYPGTSTMTCLGYNPYYYDEDGNIHYNRDPNIRSTDYQCSEGHNFSISRKDGEPDQINIW